MAKGKATETEVKVTFRPSGDGRTTVFTFSGSDSALQLLMYSEDADELAVMIENLVTDGESFVDLIDGFLADPETELPEQPTEWVDYPDVH